MVNSNNLVKLKIITKNYSNRISGSQRNLPKKLFVFINRLFLNLKYSIEFNFHFIELLFLNYFVAEPCYIITINNNRGMKS